MVPDDLIDLCKAYMRVDGDEDDALIRLFANAAAEYLQKGGASETAGHRYTLALCALTCHYYDHRADTNPLAAPIPTSLRNLISQIKLGPATAEEYAGVL